MLSTSRVSGMRKGCLAGRHLALPEITSVDPAIGFTVIAKVLCHCVVPLNPVLAVRCAVLPTGMSVCSRKAKVDRPVEAFQEATCLFSFHSHFSGPAGNNFWGWDFLLLRTSRGGGSAAVPAGAPCCVPPQTARLQLGAAGAHCAIIPCRFHSAAVGTGQLDAQAALPLPAAAVAASVFRYCLYCFMSPRALFEVIHTYKIHRKWRANWESGVFIRKLTPMGRNSPSKAQRYWWYLVGLWWLDPKRNKMLCSFLFSEYGDN